jgi:hypothetical protein
MGLCLDDANEGSARRTYSEKVNSSGQAARMAMKQWL